MHLSRKNKKRGLVVMVINAAFNNIPVISWSVLLVEETRIPGENHGDDASH
jgi:hypothetical protein